MRSTSTAYGGITLIQAGGRRFETVGATHPQVERADQLQYELREGPCVDAAVEIKSVHSESLSDDPRWPTWGPAAAEFGFHSIISAEVHGRGQRIGALNLYGCSRTTFTSDDESNRRIGEIVAEIVATRQLPECVETIAAE